MSTASLGGSQNQKWANDSTAYGRKMLEKMGWADGKGLGKELQGDKTFVRVKKRTDNLGLGQESYSSVKGGGPNGCANRVDAAAGQKGWMQTNDNFAGVLASLSATYGSEHKKKKKKRDKKKRKRALERGEDMDDDGNVSNDGVGKAEAHALSAFSSRKKHIKSKNVSRLSEKQLACILGGVPSNSPWGNSPVSKVVKEERPKKKRKKDKKKKEKKTKKEDLHVAVVSDETEKKEKKKKKKKKKRKE